jgi:hypothetical protein
LSQDRTQQEIVQARMAGIDPELMKQALGVPVELLQICTRAAAKQVEDRYASALEMRDALRAYIRANNLEFSAEQLRAVLSDLYESERVEIRRLVDQRMKQANLEDDHPSFGAQLIPVAPAVLGGLGGATFTGNASTYVLPATPTNKTKWIAALVLVALLAGVGGRWLSRAERPSSVALPSVAAAPGPTSEARNAVAQPKLVTLKIAASPRDTEISLDGAKLDSNPFQGQFPKDSALHRLELRCFGRVTEARMIRLDQDLDLLIALPVDKATKLKSGAATGAGAKPGAKRPIDEAVPAATAPLPAAAPLTHRDAAAPARPIDDSDPYAK